ncbi:MAG TPA: rhodanese-like domain-containing protein [Brumimicrobium sp.]|nr:rhodanese-like domain-containing protein [Brumimicrobium sp.]
MSFLRKLFRIAPPLDYKQLVNDGALIIDVRSKGEFSRGHIRNSKCIPLERINQESNKIKKDQPIILCCRSGSRSGMARRMLQQKGHTQVYNGGSWLGLQNKLK